MEMREALQEKEDAKGMKAKQREKVPTSLYLQKYYITIYRIDLSVVWIRILVIPGSVLRFRDVLSRIWIS
jgi:hypothetical protein